MWLQQLARGGEIPHGHRVAEEGWRGLDVFASVCALRLFSWKERRDIATYASAAIGELGPFELITDGTELPVFAFKLKDEVDGYSAFDVSSGMRERGWQVPAYSFPENREDLVALRVVVRNGYSRDPADMFLDDLRRLLPRLEKQLSPAHDGSDASFSH